MINKIRNLFNKLKKNKTSDEQFEDDFSAKNRDPDLPPVPNQ